LTYTYDNGGKRKTKPSIVNGANVYGGFNNRLMYSVTSNGIDLL
jgi:hypothetical protein